MNADLAVYCEELRALVRESGVSIITAVQVPNPNRQPIDVGCSLSPRVIDYCNILSVEVIERDYPTRIVCWS